MYGEATFELNPPPPLTKGRQLFSNILQLHQNTQYIDAPYSRFITHGGPPPLPPQLSQSEIAQHGLHLLLKRSHDPTVNGLSKVIVFKVRLRRPKIAADAPSHSICVLLAALH